ncbi:MAG: tRNA-dihydrouridine synthase family protein [Candidatus Diapherotrites archaeon]|nr:tRNA-dihydrouridine synthase family protein [Candidatus Diapherotrites archaeon]
MKQTYCGIPVQSRFFLSPMMAFTIRPFRIQAMEYGAGFCFTEMEHASAIIHSQKTRERLVPTPPEMPCGVQLAGHDTKIFLEALEQVEKHFPLIDLNFGCPSKRILETQCGSWLLKDLPKMKQIISDVAAATDKPVTVKTRIGFDCNQVEEIVKMVGATKAQSLTLHGRTTLQGFGGNADWEAIKAAKQHSPIPIVGNGDIADGKTAREKIEEGFCDFVLIGRRAIGNPGIFSECMQRPAHSKRLQLERFLELARQTQEEIPVVRNGIMAFTKGTPHSSPLREQIGKMHGLEEIVEFVALNPLTA